MSTPGSRMPSVRVGRLVGLIACTISAGLEEDASLLAPVRGGGSKTSCHGREPPFLYIGLYEYETALPKVDMDCTRAIGAYGGE